MTTSIDRIRKRAKRTKPPSSDDPREELRRLCNQHRAMTKAALALGNMAADKKNRETGEPILNRLPEDVREALRAQAKEIKRKASLLETPMRRECRKFPVYTSWLRDVAGVGDVLSAYLLSMVDIRKADKPSRLNRYCGNGVGHDGKRDIMSAEIRWNQDLKMRLYLWATFQRMNQAQIGKTSKYLRLWEDTKHRCATATNPEASKGFIDAKGRRKAIGVFLEDLYVVWRAHEGLPVWPSWYAAARGYSHGGKICVNEPQMLTVEEAIALVGDCGWLEVPQATAAE